MTITAEQKRQAIERELNYWKCIYSWRVRDGKMTKEESDDELGVMAAILEDYNALAEKERRL